MARKQRAMPPSMQDPNIRQGVVYLVILVKIDVKQLALSGKDFEWARPAACPRCGAGLWWHGFVTAYLACLVEAVFLRRAYCPNCKSVHRLRPDSHWSRFQSSINSITRIISHRQKHGRWKPDLPRSRQRQWWRHLRRKVKLCLGLNFDGTWFEGFVALLKAGIIPVSRVMDCDKKPG
jgi:hypothetical protein